MKQKLNTNSLTSNTFIHSQNSIIDEQTHMQCWGKNESGQAEVPDVVSYSLLSISLGGRHSCAISLVGKVHCWG